MKVELKIYQGLEIKTVKISNNPGAIRENEVYQGVSQYYPNIGMRFMCGRLSTNIVVKIIEETETGGVFETYSGSQYKWEVITEGTYYKSMLYDRPDKIVKLLEEYNK